MFFFGKTAIFACPEETDSQGIFYDMKKTLLLFAFILASFSLKAQVEIGLSAGANVASQRLSYLDYGSIRWQCSCQDGGTSRSINRWNVGAFALFGLHKNWALRLGAYYSQKGQEESTFDYDGEGLIFRYVDRVNYLEFPINLRFNLVSGTEGEALFLDAGFYWARGVSGEERLYSGDPVGNRTRKVAFNDYGEHWEGDEHLVSPGDFGINYGFGLRIRRVVFEMHHSFGLENTLPAYRKDNKKAYAKNSVFSFNVSYILFKA